MEHEIETGIVVVADKDALNQILRGPVFRSPSTKDCSIMGFASNPLFMETNPFPLILKGSVPLV